MNSSILITLPRYDDATEYLSQFSIVIEKEAVNKNISLKKLEENKVNRKEFEKVINKLNPKMIIFNGHGSEESIYGHKGESIVEFGSNEKLLKERIVYARSCNVATILGRKCMADCFIGYNLPFMFYTDSNWSTKPLNDNTARLFLEPSNLVPLSLIKGNSTFEAHEHSKNQILRNINKVLASNKEESFILAEALWNNYAGQELIGNSSAKL